MNTYYAAYDKFNEKYITESMFKHIQDVKDYISTQSKNVQARLEVKKVKIVSED